MKNESHKGFKSDGYQHSEVGEKPMKHHNATDAEEHKITHNFMTTHEDERPVHPGEKGARGHMGMEHGKPDEPAGGQERFSEGEAARPGPVWQTKPEPKKVPNY